MNAAKLVSAAQEVGVQLTRDSAGRLIATPKGRLPPALRAELSSHKADVLALLERQAAARAAGEEVAMEATPACAECGSTAWHLSLVDDEGRRTCLDCLTGRTQLRRAGAPA